MDQVSSSIERFPSDSVKLSCRHDPWPHLGYVLFVLKEAYREFEERVGQMKSPRGAKTGLIKSAVNSFSRDFTVTELEQACPGVSRDMVRRVLWQLRRGARYGARDEGPQPDGGRRGNTL